MKAVQNLYWLCIEQAVVLSPNENANGNVCLSVNTLAQKLPNNISPPFVLAFIIPIVDLKTINR